MARISNLSLASTNVYIWCGYDSCHARSLLSVSSSHTDYIFFVLYVSTCTHIDVTHSKPINHPLCTFNSGVFSWTRIDRIRRKIVSVESTEPLLFHSNSLTFFSIVLLPPFFVSRPSFRSLVLSVIHWFEWQLSLIHLYCRTNFSTIVLSISIYDEINTNI